MPPHVLETHSFPHTVPLNREVQADAASARRPFVSGSEEGQRSGRADWLSQMAWSERGCPIKRSALPGVRAHDATASSKGLILGSLFGISFGLHLSWLELGDGLTPSPPVTSS